MDWLLTTLTLLLGLYMAWNIGANDVANAMGTSVGSKALTLRKAICLAAVLEFAGAFFVGSNVSETIQKGIVDPTMFAADPTLFVLGMMGSLLATSLLLQMASYLALPISTTHAIVGAVLGFGLVIGGSDAIFWPKVKAIAASWVVSPLLSGTLSYFLFALIQKKILYALNPLKAIQKFLPSLVFFCFFAIFSSLLYKGFSPFSLQFDTLSYFSLSALLSFIAFFLCYKFVQNIAESKLEPASGFHPFQTTNLEKALHHLEKAYLSNRNTPYEQQFSTLFNQVCSLTETVKKSTQTPLTPPVEKLFVLLQILSACLIAFAHGANDIANAIGPVAAILQVLKTHSLSSHSPIPLWLLALGGGGIVFGLATWGWRVIETIGKKITDLTPAQGFAAEFSAAITILLASKIGLPISSTHALIGAILGVGLNHGIQALNLQMLRGIVISWIVTIPLCALLSILSFYALRFLHAIV